MPPISAVVILALVLAAAIVVKVGCPPSAWVTTNSPDPAASDRGSDIYKFPDSAGILPPDRRKLPGGTHLTERILGKEAADTGSSTQLSPLKDR